MLKSKEIIFTGVESSGKSTLAQALSHIHEGIYVAEYARTYLQEIGLNYTAQDVENIALGQAQCQQKTYAKYPFQKHIFIDTDALVCKIWYEFKYTKSSNIINQLWENQSADLYVLCDINMPWQKDELRETPDENIRQLLFNLYEAELKRANRNYIFVSGNIEQRIAQVNKALISL